MIESFLTQEMLTRGETSIGEYLITGQSDYNNLIQESWTDITRDLIDMNYEVRRLCKRLEVEASDTQTTTFTGTKTDEDYAQRMRLVFIATVCTGTFIFTLKGTNDDGVTYDNINTINNAGTSASTFTITAATTTSYLLTALYKKYRLDITSAGTTITYSSYLIEEVYTSMHRDKTRANIYRSLISEMGDEFRGKWEMYEDKYQRNLGTAKMIFDVGDDEEISKTEAGRETQNIIFN